MLGRMGEMLARRYFPPNVGHIAERRLPALGGRDACRCRTSRPCSASSLAIPLAWLASYNMTPSRRVGYPVARLVHHGVPLGARDDLDDPAGRDARLRHAARRARADAVLHRLRRQAVRRGDRGDRARPGRGDPRDGRQRVCRCSCSRCCRRCASPGPASRSTPGTSCSAPRRWSASSAPAAWAGTCARACSASPRSDVAAILLSIIVVVVVAELFSAWLRTRIAQAIA